MAEQRRYWSIETCGWVASPGALDLLATPWGLAGARTGRSTPAPSTSVPGQRRPHADRETAGR